MGARLRLLRRRIRGIQSTKKITSAMELIAASQIRRAQQRVEQARAYAEQITQAVQDVTSQTDLLEHPLLERREDRTAAAVLVVTSDRGLAGAYNANVLRTTEELMQTLRHEGKEPKIYVTGRKGQSYFRFRQRPVEQQVVSIWAVANGFTDDLPVADVRRFESELQEFLRDRFGSIYERIRDEGTLPEDAEGKLREAIEEFKGQFSPSKEAGAGKEAEADELEEGEESEEKMKRVRRKPKKDEG